MNPNPLVSVILPVYNGERHIAQSIQSVLAQQHKNFELLIINDGSTDQSSAIIRLFPDTRIRYFEQENKGVSAARNVGLQNMQGDFFCFLDSDDCLTENSISSRLLIFEKDGSVSFVDGKVKIFNKDLSAIINEWTPRFKGNPFRKMFLFSDKCFFGPTWLVKRLKDTPYKVEESLKYCEDIMFYVSISRNGLYSYTNECILHYRKHASSAMRSTAGIAGGFLNLREILSKNYPEFGLMSRFRFDLKTRKIVFLLLSRSGKWANGLAYALWGQVPLA